MTDVVITSVILAFDSCKATFLTNGVLPPKTPKIHKRLVWTPPCNNAYKVNIDVSKFGDTQWGFSVVIRDGEGNIFVAHTKLVG